MFAASIKRLTTEGTILPAVLASGSGRTHVQAQTVFEVQQEVFVWRWPWPLVLKEGGRFKKTSGTRTSGRTQVDLPVAIQSVQQLLLEALVQPGGPEALELGFGLLKQTYPVHPRLIRAAQVRKELRLSS